MKLEIDSTKDSAASIHKAIELLQMLAKEQNGQASSVPKHIEAVDTAQQEQQTAIGFASMFANPEPQSTHNQSQESATAPSFDSFLGLVNATNKEEDKEEEPTPQIQFF